MAKFIPQTEAPSTTDKNYIRYDKGGYNYCIEISSGSCLSNCVGYAWGRWRCLLGKYHNLSRGNAENWWGHTSDGYKRGQTPKLGAVVCWSKGRVGVESDGAGHVGIVEVIREDEIVVSMSEHLGRRWFTRTFKKGSYDYNGYVFQGFIYLPVEFEEDKKTETTTNKTPTTSKAKFAKGDKVKVTKAVTYEGKSFKVYYDTYSVLEVSGDRVVIGINGTITAAVKDTNLTKVTATTEKKSVETIAKEVIAGKWGNGAERRKKLEAAGYNYNDVQRYVNALLR